MANFLTAEWRNLLLLNYAVPDTLLSPYLPAGCELDRWQGKAYVSLVAFQFLNTKVMGIRWPGFTNFPEVNLRFYVRRGSERGVCFIREFVPSAWVSFLARSLYNEPYQPAEMGWSITPERLGYWLRKDGVTLQLAADRQDTAYLPAGDSVEHFFKEHENGFGKSKKGETTLYQVKHPHWRVYPIKQVTIEADWGRLYGEQFAFLSRCSPDSVVLAEGSNITVGFLAAK